MKNVNDEIFFHINSNASLSPYPRLKKGDSINIGGTDNPFFGLYKKYERTYPVIDINTNQITEVQGAHLIRNVANGNFTPGNDFPQIAHQVCQHYLMLSRELIWEQVRQRVNPSAPSRQKGMWLVNTIEDADRWLKVLGFEPSTFNVLRVKASGKAITVDSEFLGGAGGLLTTWYENSERYWLEETTNSPLLETIFEGNLEVLEVYD